MIDFMRYRELKENGGLQLQKVGGQAVVFLKKFHPNTGAEQLPDMGPVDVQLLLKQRENSAKVLEGHDLLLADLKAMGIDTTPKAD
jgi:hypothetical protein